MLYFYKKKIMHTTFKLPLKSIVRFTFVLCIAITLQSCAKKLTFPVSVVVPAAEGTVKIKKDKNRNYTIDLRLIRLADSKRLSPPKNMYIVWMESETNGTRNLGQLKTSSGMFSKTLKSSLKTVSSFKPTKIYITAEDDAGIQYPSGQTVLSTDSF
jgi:hypothetical protein